VHRFAAVSLLSTTIIKRHRFSLNFHTPAKEGVMIPKMPQKAAEIIAAVERAGGRCYLVGGALRDLMRGQFPTDWDFAATLPPKALVTVFPGAKPVGGALGTVQVPMAGGGRYEITPCRVEGPYSDHRHPDDVRFVPDILADLARRDFTVNAMAYDGRVLLDPFGGQQDIRRRLLRCVGNPVHRFQEDPLRILRLFRFAAQLGFTAEWGTFGAACDAVDLLATLPKERVRAELSQILLSPGPQVIGPLIARGGLAAYGFSFAPALNALAKVPALPLCRWWALAALCGADTATVCQAFGFSRRFAGQLAACTRLYRAGPAKDKTALKQKLRHTHTDFAPLAATFAAVSPAFAGEPALFAEICARKEPYRLEELAVDGDMLRYEGISGRQCGRMLEELLGAVIKNPALNKASVLLGLARGLQRVL